MNKILEWLNGKKTAIGCAFLLISRFFVETGIGDGVEWVSTVITACNWLGEALGAIGLAHKGIKIMGK